jgi:hypothetical protein
MRSPATSVGGSPLLEQEGAGLQSSGTAFDLETGLSPGSSRRPALKRTTRVEAFPEALKPSLTRMNARAPTEAKKGLTATHANSKIAATHSQQSTSPFLTATRIVFPNSCFRQSRPPTAATPPRFGRSPDPIVTAQSNHSGEMRFLPQGGDNFSHGFDIVSSEDSGVPEVYNPDRFLRRHP